MSDLQQLPDEGIHALSQHICDLVTKSKFSHAPTIETLKIMILQHAIKYHKARDWIRQQDQSQLTYQVLLSHCKMLEGHCKWYQKAKERGHANLSSITATTSSLHLDAITKSKICCNKCGYSHLNGKCLAKGQQCYVGGGYDHYTALCQQRGCSRITSSKDALSPTNAVPAVDITPATPHVGTGAKVIACVVIPGPHPAAPHIVLPVAHHLGAPHIPKGVLHPTCTTRML